MLCSPAQFATMAHRSLFNQQTSDGDQVRDQVIDQHNLLAIQIHFIVNMQISLKMSIRLGMQ